MLESQDQDDCLYWLYQMKRTRLNGKADYTKDGAISINELDLYLSERVKKLTQGKQTPTTTKPMTIQDFPVAWAR